jgi:hypothetical protein
MSCGVDKEESKFYSDVARIGEGKEKLFFFWLEAHERKYLACLAEFFHVLAKIGGFFGWTFEEQFTINAVLQYHIICCFGFWSMIGIVLLPMLELLWSCKLNQLINNLNYIFKNNRTFF